MRLRKTVPVQGTETAFRITQLFTPEMGGLQQASEVGRRDIAVIPYHEFLRVGAILGDARPSWASQGASDTLPCSKGGKAGYSLLTVGDTSDRYPFLPSAPDNAGYARNEQGAILGISASRQRLRIHQWETGHFQ